MRFVVAIAAVVVVFGGAAAVVFGGAGRVRAVEQHVGDPGPLTTRGAKPSGFAAVVNPLSQVPVSGELYEASCPSSTSCVAVGESGDRVPFVLVGDPSSWGSAQAHAVKLGRDVGERDSAIWSVSCTSSSSCVGVGSDGNGQALVLVGDPSTWSASDAHEVSFKNGDSGGLDSVTCISSSWCVAVGWDGDEYGDESRPVVLTGDPATWSAAQVHVIDRDGELSAVTCPSASSCIAVGDGFVRGLGQQPLVLVGDPATWSSADVHVIAPRGVHGDGGFRSVTCASATSCVAVGNSDYTSQPLVLVGDPSIWGSGQARELVLGPTFGSGGGLNSVTCTSSSSCIAVGSDWHNGLLMVAGDPSTWDASQVRRLSLGAASSHHRELASILCASSSACVAVGADEGNRNGTRTEPLVVVGDPSTWGATEAREIMLTGVAFGAQARLSTFACASATSCLDLGRDQGTYLVRGDPATWDTAGVTQLPPDIPAGRDAGTTFYDSACPEATFCVAVGTAAGSPFVLVGDPATWDSAQGQTIHLARKDGSGGTLSSVSCVSRTWCVGVGSGYSYVHGGYEFVLMGNPATWTGANAKEFRFETRVQPWGWLASVSCSSRTHCVAVGSVVELGSSTHPKPTTYRPIVIAGDPSSWGTGSARQIVLGPALGTAARLLSVACTSRTYCIGVGQAIKGMKPLVIEGNPAEWGASSAVTLAADPVTSTTVRGFYLSASRDLRSISCETAHYCVAVGGDHHGAPWYITGDPATWRGRVLERPESDGAGFVTAGFVSVSCTPTACFVGGYANGGDFVASFGGG